MQKLGVNEIRERYLKFFESKGHLRLPSFSLVPQNDPNLLLINAGMAPMKPYFTGQSVPPRKRVTTCQKCIRTLDIENVGKTARHGTFFEMLGNFSFGDYFKTEAIQWSWEFLTKDLQIPENLLHVSIYEDDDEAYDIWHNIVGLPDERINRMGKEDNFWELSSGPCGPCSEIYVDRGVERGCGRPDCHVGCDCDRFIEVWNNVFTQFNRSEEGEYTRLEHPNIDTGMGLERLACVMQDVENMFDIDTIRRIIDKVCALSGKTYNVDPKTDMSIRVIVDHARGMTMMAADGILPSNEGRGYIMRRLIRRAARHGRLLGIKEAFLTKVVEQAIQESATAYPELVDKHDYIISVIANEEARFYKTLDAGLEILKEYIDEAKAAGNTVLAGPQVFKLHDTYGFPLDLTLEIASESGLTTDVDGFHAEMKKQKERARAAFKANEDSGWATGSLSVCVGDPNTVFTGYDEISSEAKVVRIFDNNELVEAANQDADITFMLDQTPFYAEMGGQVGDKGTVVALDGSFEVQVTDCRKVGDGKFLHYGHVVAGQFATGAAVKATVEAADRLSICRNHTATHLMHSALRAVLGDHVKQSGSYVNAENLRFDFSHFKGCSAEELAQVEDLVNAKILENMPVVTDVKSKDEAVAEGAMALFGEKYGDVVRQVKCGDFSMELCGGTHVSNTSVIGLFKIISEGAVAAGVRRIEAVTGLKAVEYVKNQETMLKAACAVAKATPADLANKIQTMADNAKDLSKANSELKAQLNAAKAGEFITANLKDVDGIKVVAGRVDGMSADDMRGYCETLRDKVGSGVVLLGAANDDKVVVLCACTKDMIPAGINCGQIVKAFAQVCGGNGGGKPDMAQAGGKDASQMDKAFETALATIQSMKK
ncbi:MAG: alanine--tRNA ligase [Clostridia bacterium]|nr:alanine--tRNA ligase [Clostridia bacterium]